ncbi:MAG: hypothetical protein HY298_27675 [Verrucomicrobia bacterium]|nr:hypothetical protein [Verrucomicrobiota bacterium]
MIVFIGSVFSFLFNFLTTAEGWVEDGIPIPSCRHSVAGCFAARNHRLQRLARTNSGTRLLNKPEMASDITPGAAVPGEHLNGFSTNAIREIFGSHLEILRQAGASGIGVSAETPESVHRPGAALFPP